MEQYEKKRPPDCSRVPTRHVTSALETNQAADLRPAVPRIASCPCRHSYLGHRTRSKLGMACPKLPTLIHPLRDLRGEL